jgi:hypothetical protein
MCVHVSVCVCIYICMCMFVVLGIRTQDLGLARQGFYHLSYTPRPTCILLGNRPTNMWF